MAYLGNIAAMRGGRLTQMMLMGTSKNTYTQSVRRASRSRKRLIRDESSIFRGILIWLWLCLALAAQTACRDTGPDPALDQPAYWLALAEHSAQGIEDAQDVEFALVTKAEAMSLIAQSAHAMGDADSFGRAIQAVKACAKQVSDSELRDEIRWGLTEALAEGGRFDEAQAVVDEMALPVKRALAQMSIAVAHAHRGDHVNYERLSRAAERALLEAEDLADPQAPLAWWDTGWAWPVLVEGRLEASDVDGAWALAELRVQKNPADLTALLAKIAQKLADLGDPAAADRLKQAESGMAGLLALTDEEESFFAGTDLAYAALAQAYWAASAPEKALETIELIQMPDLKAEALSAGAIYLSTGGSKQEARALLRRARDLLDKPANPLWIDPWSRYEVARNGLRAGDARATANWIDSIEDPMARALAQVGALGGVVEGGK